MYLCGPGKHNCQPFCGPEGRFYCSDSVCSLWPAPFSYLCVSMMILCVCWKLSAAEQVKTDCCLRLLWSPLYWLRCLCLVLWPLRTITTLALREQDERSYPRPQQVEWPRRSITTLALREQDERSDPRPQQVEWPRPRPQQTTLMMMANHRRRVPQLTTPASHQHHRRPRLATITTDDPG